MIVLLLAAAAAAPSPTCNGSVAVPGFAAWSHPAGSSLTVEGEATLALKPANGVHYDPPLARPAASGTFGGFFPLTVKTAARYRIALSAHGWMDVIDHGQRLKSAAHQEGPACSGMAKIVDFDLKPGRYWLQLSEAKAPSINVMIVPSGALPAAGKPAA